jgi:hypothetical protein
MSLALNDPTPEYEIASAALSRAVSAAWKTPNLVFLPLCSDIARLPGGQNEDILNVATDMGLVVGGRFPNSNAIEVAKMI